MADEPKPLAIVPTFLRTTADMLMLRECLDSLRETASDDCDVLIVDDGSSAADLKKGIEELAVHYKADVHFKEENSGFSRTVNVGLRNARDRGSDAILVNADISFGLTKDWVGMMQRQVGPDGEQLASIVGALLLYPNHTIQHGGIFFSLLTRDFGHRFQHGPGDLPEAQFAAECPCTGALLFIRHECLEALGPFDPRFQMGWEDVDYNVRAWQSGRSVVYQPGVRAVHHESAFRGRRDPKIARWTQDSWLYFCGKHRDVNFAEWCPNLLLP